MTYKLQLPKTWKIHPVFHAALLTPYKETDTHGPNDMNPSPDLIDREEEYEVEAIISHRKRGKGLEYLVTWKGYSLVDNTWEPQKNLKEAQEILDAFKQQHSL